MNFEKARVLLDEAEKSHTCLSHGKKSAAKECRKYLMEVKKMMDSGRKETLTTLKALPTKSRVKSVLEEPVDAHSHVFLKEKNVKPTLKPRVKKN